MHCLGGPHLALMSSPRKKSCSSQCPQYVGRDLGHNWGSQSYRSVGFEF